VKKRFLFGWITRQRSHVIRGHAQVAGFIEPHFANTAFALFDQTTMPARVTFQRPGVEMFGEFGRTFYGHRIEDGCERC
jgi:hypothetical protein